MKTSIGRRVVAAVILAFAASLCAADGEAPAGPVVLTVAGNISKTNRPPYNEKRDVFLKYHERTFEKAFEFDRAMLEGLGMTEIRIDYERWDGPITFSGPRLADVLKAAGWQGGALVTLSLDGYSTRIAAAEVEAREWVVATRTDGRALGIGERGPLWLVFGPPGERPVTEDESAMWPWALFLIQCE